MQSELFRKEIPSIVKSHLRKRSLLKLENSSAFNRFGKDG